jgi:hypothetical protein
LKYFLNFLLLLLLLAGCDADKPQPVYSGSDYFPLETGAYQVYSVDEVRYTNGPGPQTEHYELMTRIVDSFPTNDNAWTYVIYRSKRADDSKPWEVLDTWSARKDNMRAIMTEGNTSFVKLSFPVKDGGQWNGNEYNTLGEDAYDLKNVGQPMELNGLSFENTATVEQELNDDIIVFRDERSETYARGVGLISRTVVQLHYCTDDACLGQQVVEEGTEVNMKIKDYGND